MSEAQPILVLLGDPRLPDTVKRDGRFNSEDGETVLRLKEALALLPGRDFVYLDDHAAIVDSLRAQRGGLVLNFCDEGYRNEAEKELHVPALLELFDLPYTGSPPACLGLCHDKFQVHAVAAALGVPVPRFVLLARVEEASVAAAADELGHPVLLKPERGDGSIGIGREALIRSRDDIPAAVAALRRSLGGVPALVEEYLPGTEYLAGLIGNPEDALIDLPLLEVDYSALPPEAPAILCYESKWHPESPYWRDLRFPPAQLVGTERERISEWCRLLFERLGCRDYCRMDFRADREGNIRLMEVNPNPGWCWDGKLALMAEAAGWSYGDLLEKLIEAAERRTGTEH
jgi:D-alanine-D-alanine ligase